MPRPKPIRPAPAGAGRRLDTLESLDHFLDGLAPGPTLGRPPGVRLAAGVNLPRLAGLLLRQVLADPAAAVIVRRVTTVLRAPMTAAEKPRWKADVSELWWLGVLLRTFRDDAVNLRSVLGGFEKAGWTPTIPNPLRSSGRGNAKERRRETIKSLNRAMPPETIHFSSDRNGGIRWVGHV